MSRDPTVPVNLTTTTPVGPVERTLAATQATDRVERLRYWRRGGSTGIYEQRISNTDYDGRWYSTIDNWSSVAPLQVTDIDGVGAVQLPTWSFIGTEAFAGGVLSASLELTTAQVYTPGSWVLQAEADSADVWSASHRPGTATPTATSITVVSGASPQTHTIDVTTLVNEVMAGAAWTPGRPINFWVKPLTIGAFVYARFEAVPSAHAAKLTMTPYAHTPYAFNNANYLYKTSGAASVAPDAAYLAIAVKFRVNGAALPSPSGSAMDIVQAATTIMQLIRLNIAYNNDSNTDAGLYATDYSVVGFKDNFLLPAPGDGWHTLHIFWDAANQDFHSYVNGVDTSYVSPPAAFSVGPGVVDFTSVTNWQIGAGGGTPGSGSRFWGDMAMVWVGISATPVAAFNDPTLFYKGGDCDLGSDGTRYGRLPAPQIFFGGRQTPTNWQAGTNQGTGGDFVYVP